MELCLTLFCPHHNGFCINMGSDESHLNVSFTVRAKVSEKYATIQEREAPKRGIESTWSADQLNAFPLGHTLALVIADKIY